MLTTVEEVREFRRVVESFPHFVASHVWIADGGGTRFVPWSWQVRLARVWRERRQVVILKARQLGVSWLAAAYALWMALTERGALVLLVSQTEADAVELLGKVQFIFDHLPEFLKPDSRNNLRCLKFPDLHSAIHQNDHFPDWPSAGMGKSATTEGARMAENALVKALAMQAATTAVVEILKGGASTSPGFNPDAPHPEVGGYSKWRAHPSGGVDHVSGHGTYHATPVAGGHSLKFTPHGGGQSQHLGNFPDHKAADHAQIAHDAKLSAAGEAEAGRRRATNPPPPKISHDPLGKAQTAKP